jgi:hypothetical protein
MGARTTYNIGPEVLARRVIGDPPECLQPVSQLSAVLLHSVLHYFHPMANLAKVTVRLPHHRLPSVADFLGGRDSIPTEVEM